MKRQAIMFALGILFGLGIIWMVVSGCSHQKTKEETRQADCETAGNSRAFCQYLIFGQK